MRPDFSYCELLEKGHVKLDNHFPLDNKPTYFEERLLHVIRQAIKNKKPGKSEIMKEMRREFKQEVEIDYMIMADCKSAFDEVMQQMYKDSSFAHLLKNIT